MNVETTLKANRPGSAVDRDADPDGHERRQRNARTLDRAEIKARVADILNRRPAVGLALGVVRNGSLESFYGHGYADIASKRPVTEDTVFRIASITKTFTAIAVMQLWEQGRVDLDAPANDYLRAFQLVPAKASFRLATVRHLLTHTAGIDEVVRVSDLLRPDWGDSVKLGEPIPTLAEFYGGALRLGREPGGTFTYTNHAFAVLQQIVEDVSATPFDRYLRQRIFEPLGMADTDIVRSERVKARLATGYELGARGPRAVVNREWVTAGASSIYSTPRDMARYLAALGGGANEHGAVLKPATLATMFEPHYQPDPRLPGMGLGFDRNTAGGHRLVGHGGILPGFNSQIFVAPDDGIGVMAFTNGARLAMLWLPTELGRLLNHVLGVPDDAVRTDIPHHPEIWEELCGRYAVPGRITDARSRMMLGLGAQVFVRGGELVLRLLHPVPRLYRGFTLHPDDEKDPYVFRIDLAEFGLSTARIVFDRGGGAGTTAIHIDLFPMSLHKQSRRTRPPARLTRMLPVLLLAAGAVAVRRLSAVRRRGERRGVNGRT
jgi:CubicO group peptidase (beta-lactamase class C family)